MRIITKVLKMDAVYWPPIGVNESAEKVYGNPEPIKCRWTDQQVVERDEEGREIVFMSSVMVGQDLQLEGKIWKGKLEDLEGPNPPDDAKQIRRFYKTPTMNARRFVRVALL